MNCLPEDTSDAAREEIQGILDRFHDRAVMDRIHPVDRLAIENAMIAYVQAGKIPEEDLFDFMSMIGKATRRFDEDQQNSD
jgi:predicted AAA+ superfamily ATPase